MRHLPLYLGPPPAAVEVESPLTLDTGCTRCNLPVLGKARNVCIGAEGEPGGLLVVGEGPGRDEDTLKRPFVGASGKLLRSMIARHWPGSWALDNATRCFKGKAELTDGAVDACRPYLAQTVREVAPTRIICVGAWAAYSVMGRGVAPFTTRRGYAYAMRIHGAVAAAAKLGADIEPMLGHSPPTPVPVFFVIHPAAALRNRFVRKWFEDDFAWACTATPPVPPWDAQVHVVETVDDARQAVAYLRSGEWASFDVETAGLMYDPSFRITSLSLCSADDRDAWLWSSDALRDPAVSAPLKEYMRDPTVHKVAQNGKYDENSMASWERLGVQVRGLIFDTRLARKLLDPESPAKLEKTAELVGMGGMKEENKEAKAQAVKAVRAIIAAEHRYAKAQATPQTGKRKVRLVQPPPLSSLGIDAALEPVVRDPDQSTESWVYAVLDHGQRDVLWRYNARDAVATAALTELVRPQLAAMPPLQRVYDRILHGASGAIAQIERWGIAADRDALLLFDRHLEVLEHNARQVLDSYYPEANWNSVPQLRDILFRKLGLPVVKLTDNGNESTDKDALEQLKGQHPLIPALTEHRRVTKLRGTYASGMLAHLRPDGRIHPSILLDGARSGRTSSQDPNLQNIPRVDDRPADKGGKPEGKMARDIFYAPEGHVLVQADYSQIELRVAAMLSDDPVMLEIFASGVDFHFRTAQLISKIAWGVNPEDVPPKGEFRSKAKSVNFGVMYGKTAGSLAEKWGCTKVEAQRVIDAIKGQFRKFAQWCAERLAEGRRTGESWTWWDGQPARRRSLYRIADQEDGSRITAENGTVNNPIQGTASDYCVASLTEVVRWILDDAVPAKLVLPVHDSLLLEVRRDAVDEVVHALPELMLQWPSGNVKLAVDVEVGPSWGSLAKVAA